MKKLISVLMVLAMMLCLVPAVSADSPAAPEYANNKKKDFYEYINELYDLIESLQSKQNFRKGCIMPEAARMTVSCI